MSGTVYHAYDGIHCVADMDGDGGILRAYTWGAGVDNLLAVTLIDGAATNTLYAVTDPLGTVHALIATDGTVSVSYTYDSWGNLLSVSGDETLIASLRFTWQGREYSYATGLHNFRARWYDPAAGRWLSKDPIGLEGGLNLYEAFGNNPVCFGDPEGELVLFDYGLFEDFLADYMPDFFEDRYPLIEPSAHSVFDILAEWINEPLVIARENITIKIMQIRESVFGAYRPECGNEGYYFQQGTKQEIITGDDIREALFLSTLKGRPGMKKQGRELRTKARLNGRYKGNERFRRERPPKQHTPGKTHRRKSKGKGK